MKLMQEVKKRLTNEDTSKKKMLTPPPTGKVKEARNVKSEHRLRWDAIASSMDATGLENPFLGIPGFRDVPTRDHAQLFRLKLTACQTLYDFATSCYLKEKEMKRQTLVELVQYIGESKNCFNDGLMQDLIFMTSINIFRSLPARRKCAGPVFDLESEEALPDNSWAHLQVVYELLLRFVASNDVDPKIAKQYLDGNFILNLLELFDSEDSRERDYVKNILHRSYGKFMTLRSFIRKTITYVFFRAVYERDYHNGIGELLELLGSIINGFALPLKEEHRNFLLHGLIPLHKVKHVMSFHQQLAYCMLQYAEKDQRLTVDIVQALLRYWPTTCAAKQILFLSEIEEMLELMQPVEFLKMRDPIFSRVTRCIVSLNYQVSERALHMWNNDTFIKIVTDHRKTLYPTIVPALCENSQNHWNPTIHGLTVYVVKLLSDADRELFDKCSAAHNQEMEKKAKKKVVPPGYAAIWASLQVEYDKGIRRGFTERPEPEAIEAKKSDADAVKKKSTRPSKKVGTSSTTTGELRKAVKARRDSVVSHDISKKQSNAGLPGDEGNRPVKVA